MSLGWPSFTSRRAVPPFLASRARVSPQVRARGITYKYGAAPFARGPLGWLVLLYRNPWRRPYGFLIDKTAGGAGRSAAYGPLRALRHAAPMVFEDGRVCGSPLREEHDSRDESKGFEFFSRGAWGWIMERGVCLISSVFCVRKQCFN